MKIRYLTIFAVIAACIAGHEQAQAAPETLDWNFDDFQNMDNATCLYGQITVLVTVPGMSYSGADFEKGSTALQHIDRDLHTALISISDPAPKLPAKIIKSDPTARAVRSGVDGDAAHVNIDGMWKVGKACEFFLLKQPGKDAKTTDTSFFILGPSGKWRHVAVINAINGTEHEGETFHNGFTSGMENMDAAADSKKPKIVLYDVWLGSSVDALRSLTHSGGESGASHWGQLHDHYFLAEGAAEPLKAAFTKLEHEYGKPVFGKDGEELPPIPSKPLPPETIAELKKLH